MVAAFAVLGVALDTQTEIVDTSRQVADTSLKKQQEKFSMFVGTDPFPILDIEINNQGQNPVEIFTLIITNQTAPGSPTQIYDIPSDTSFIPPGDSSNILSTTTLTLTPSNTYDVKAISSLGTIKKAQLVCGVASCGFSGVPGLLADVFMDPPIGIPTKNVTVAMTVTNTGDVELTGVQPDFQDEPWTAWINFPASSSMIGPTFDSISPVTLKPTQSTLFRWDLTVDGDVGDVWNFTNRATGFDGVTTVTSGNSTDELILIDPNDCGGCGPGGEGGETIILIDDLLIRPSIFMIIPSPMGDASEGPPGTVDKVMFGVNVVNPTNSTIDVSKVVMSVFAPGANNNDRLFKVSGSGCLPENISPLGPSYSDADWSCPGENQLLWKNRDNPVQLTPYSVETFMTKIIIGGTGIDLEGILIQTSVFTSFGSFGKGNYQTTMTVPHAPTLSMYMSPNVDSLADADRLANRQDIPHNQTQDFNIVLADTDLDDQTWLETGARFIINVPREWTGVNVTGSTGVISNSTQPSVELFSDGSTQIIGLTNDLIGNCDPASCGVSERQASTISFEALPPNKAIDRLYIMYVLADGEGRTASNYLFDSGPLNEIVLQVNSNSTGP